MRYRPLAVPRIWRGPSPRMLRIVVLMTLMGVLVALFPARSALAAPTLTRDGVKNAERADCVIVGNLVDFSFSTNNSSVFKLHREPALNSAGGTRTNGIYVQHPPVLGAWSVDGWCQLDYANAVLDRGGRYHDLHVRIANVHGVWRKKHSSPTANVMQLIAYASEDNLTVLSMASSLFDANFKALGVLDYLDDAIGTSMTVSMWTDSSTALGYNVAFKDFDIADLINGNDYFDNFTGPYAEGVKLESSFGAIHVEPDTTVQVSGERITGTVGDDGTYRSGFVSLGAMSAASPLSFTWAGSNCGTKILDDWSHTIIAKAGVGGSAMQVVGLDPAADPIDLEAQAITEQPFVTERDLEAVPRNDYTVIIVPDKGYAIQEVTLDGVSKGAVSSVSIPAIAADHVVTATFRRTTGYLKLVKTSANTSITASNPLYTLAGATYCVYSDKACTKQVGTLTTNAQGTSEPLEIATGSYWVKETKAPTGYAADETVHEASVSAGGTTTVQASDVPFYAPIDIVLKKLDADTGTAHPQGNASLAGAEYDLAYYAGAYERNGLPSAPTRHWVIRTGADGTAHLRSGSLVSGDAFYLDLDQVPVLPLGTVALRETKAPAGYLLPADPLVYVGRIKASGGAAKLATFAAVSANERVLRGGVKVKKVDKASSKGVKGATFSITNTSATSVSIGGKTVAPGSVCLTIESGADGIAQTSADALPCGTYEVRESKAPSGYAANATWKKTVAISKNGQVVDLTAEPCEDEKLTTSMIIKGKKSFDGSSQGKTLKAGMFSFTLSDDKGTLLQTKKNDASGNIAFDALVFESDAVGKTFSYVVREQAGTDAEIVYDTHEERVSVTVSANKDGSLAASLKTDADGIAFENHTVPAVKLPMTGQGGMAVSVAGMLTALGAAALVLRRRLG